MTDTSPPRSRSTAERLFGGSPAGVVVRLLLVSLVVGFLMQTFGVDVESLVRGTVDLFENALSGGFRELRHLGGYIITGAAVVVPVWLLLRLTRGR